MTIVNFRLTEREVCILSDTLFCDLENGAPCGMAVKLFPLDGMGGVVVGLGLWSFIEAWGFNTGSFGSRDGVRRMNDVAQERLEKLFVYHVGDDDANTLMSTIYHFGYDKLRKGFIGYRYRSETGFRPKKLRPGNVTHPWIDFDLERNPSAKFPEDFIAYAHRQRAQLEKEGKPPLGGQLVVHRLTLEEGPEGTTVVATQSACHTYPEYEPLCEKLGLEIPVVDEVTVRWPVENRKVRA